MAASTCPHCEGTSFELQEANPHGASYKQYFIQCSNCGCPFSSVPFYEATEMLRRMEKHLSAIESKVDRLR